MKEENLMECYNKLREVPAEAKKTINAGRLRGFTDINPMWRIKRMTEVFGVCGFEWRVEVVKAELVPGANGEICCFMQINLFIMDMETAAESRPIPGFGGASFVSNEKNGKYTNDECYKMAYTDALGNAMKMLGMAADVYFEKDRTKYTATPEAAVKDTRKKLDAAAYASTKMMEYIYKKMQEDSNRTIKQILSANYLITDEEAAIISTNYDNYRINNNI